MKKSSLKKRSELAKKTIIRSNANACTLPFQLSLKNFPEY